MLVEFGAAVLISFSGYMYGAYKSEKLRHRYEICCQTEDLLRTSLTALRYQHLDVYELIGYLNSCGRFSGITFLNRMPTSYSFGSSFREEWSSNLETSVLPSEIKKILGKFGIIIGASDIEGQQSSISLLEAETEKIADESRNIYMKRGKLYRSVGLLIGLMAAVLMM